uniref:Uncharacterized protein n=3 Tax=Oryza TaxID=4527 RepID=A0A0D3FTW7_9ORYZ
MAAMALLLLDAVVAFVVAWYVRATSDRSIPEKIHMAQRASRRRGGNATEIAAMQWQAFDQQFSRDPRRWHGMHGSVHMRCRAAAAAASAASY